MLQFNPEFQALMFNPYKNTTYFQEQVHHLDKFKTQ